MSSSDRVSVQRRRMVMLGDSVCLNFTQAVEELQAALVPEEERLSKPFPELLAEGIGDELRAPVELIWMAAVRQTIKGTQRRLVAAAEAMPDVLVVAHGGQESLLVPPRLLGRLPSIGRRPRFVRSRVLDGALGVGHRVRVIVWRSIGVQLKRSPERTVKTLRRLGFGNKIRSPDYADRLTKVVETLLETTQAIVVLVASPGSHVGMHLADPAEIARNDAAAARLARQHPGRVVFCPRPDQLDDRSMFLPDGAHLTGEGHCIVASSVMTVLCSSRLLSGLRT